MSSICLGKAVGAILLRVNLTPIGMQVFANALDGKGLSVTREIIAVCVGPSDTEILTLGTALTSVPTN